MLNISGILKQKNQEFQSQKDSLNNKIKQIRINSQKEDVKCQEKMTEQLETASKKLVEDKPKSFLELSK